MRSLFHFIIIISSLMISTSALATSRDPIQTEREFRELPAQLQQSVVQKTANIPNFNNQTEFNAFLKQERLSAEEVKGELQLLARLSLSLSSTNPDRYLIAQKTIDQLEVIATSSLDKSYIAMLNGRYAGKSVQDFQSAIRYYQQAVEALPATQSPQRQVLLFTLYEHLGVLHMILKKKAPALRYLLLSKDVALELASPYLIAHAESVLGKYYYKNARFTQSLSHYAEAVKYTNITENPTLSAHLQLQLARVHRALKSWDDAIRYATAASDLYQRLDHKAYLSSTMTVIAMTYAEQGLWYKAIDYHLNAQKIDIHLNNYMAQGLNLHNLGEAYFYIHDFDNALSHLLRANEVFTARNSKHYLIYNQLLLAEVYSQISNWESTLKYTKAAAILAVEMQLKDEHIEALTMGANALEKLGRFELAYQHVQDIIRLKEQSSDKQVGVDQANTLFQLQKVKLELNLNKSLLQQKQASAAQHQSIMLTALFFALLTSLLSIYLWINKKRLTAKCIEAEAQCHLEPFTHQSNYRAFEQRFEQTQAPFKAVVLLSLTDQLTADLAQGYECNSDMNAQQLTALANDLTAHGYIIRPGIFLLCFERRIEPHQLLKDINTCLVNHHGDTRLHMSLLNLPLLTDPAMRLSAKQHFGTLQMLLAAAMSLGTKKITLSALKHLILLRRNILPHRYISI